eukprot:6208306-Pleurochrysis_carterae.AAC.4
MVHQRESNIVNASADHRMVRHPSARCWYAAIFLMEDSPTTGTVAMYRGFWAGPAQSTHCAVTGMVLPCKILPGRIATKHGVRKFRATDEALAILFRYERYLSLAHKHVCAGWSDGYSSQHGSGAAAAAGSAVAKKELAVLASASDRDSGGGGGSGGGAPPTAPAIHEDYTAIVLSKV